MTRGRVERVMTQRLPSSARRPDDVIVEEPLTIRVDGTTVTTTMRTPGHDMELAVGFCVSEGLLVGAELKTVRYCGLGSAVETDFNVVDVDTDGGGPSPVPRLVTTTSACGVCGADSIEALAERLVPVAPVGLTLEVIAAVSAAATAGQSLFERTGGVHAAADFDPTTGELGVLREDIGRHNAVDKVVGRRQLDSELPATGRALWVSGRASFEMVQKAWAAGYGALVSVGAPSSLAVSTARRGGLTLAAFARSDSATVYT